LFSPSALSLALPFSLSLFLSFERRIEFFAEFFFPLKPPLQLQPSLPSIFLTSFVSLQGSKAPEMEPDVPEAPADVAAADVDVDVANVVADAADVDNAAPPVPPAAPSPLSSLIAVGRVKDGEVLRCVKVSE
jgi:hypothetical protein